MKCCKSEVEGGKNKSLKEVGKWEASHSLEKKKRSFQMGEKPKKNPSSGGKTLGV